MKIVSLEARDFRAYEGVDWKFGNCVQVSGDNGRGKSSVAEAIAYAIYGCTIGGSPYTDHLLRKGAKEGAVVVTVEHEGKLFEVTRYIGKKKKVYLDGQEVSQSDAERIIGDKERFLSVFAPSYFIRLDNKTSREMLMRLVKVPTDAEVFAQMEKPYVESLEGLPLRDPEELAKDLRKEIKENEAEYNRMEGAVETIKTRLAREVPEPRKFDMKALESVRSQIEIGTNLLAQELASLKAEHSNLRPRYDSLKRQLKDVPAAPLSDGDPCTTCGQALHGESLEQALASHNKIVAQIVALNMQTKHDMQALIERGEVVKARIAELEAQGGGEDVAELKTRLADMEREWRDVEAHNGYAARIRMERAEDDNALEKSEEYMKQIKDDQFRLGEQIKAIGQYRSTLAEMQIAQLKQHLNKVDIKLFEVAKTTGEIKPTFDLLYEGRESKSLSYSEQIRVHLEIATLFNRVTEMDYPVFIDNSESITWYDAPAATQIFEARVVEGQELRVETIDETAKGDVA